MLLKINSKLKHTDKKERLTMENKKISNSKLLFLDPQYDDVKKEKFKSKRLIKQVLLIAITCVVLLVGGYILLN